jgi:hypothetical protein
MSDLKIKVGDKVTRGQRIGKVSNQFGGEATTVHLHFNIRQNVSGVGSVYVPPYLSLVRSYKELLNPTPAEPPHASADLPTPPKEEKTAPLPRNDDEALPPEVEEGCANSAVRGRPFPEATLAPLLLTGVIALFRRRRRAS